MPSANRDVLSQSVTIAGAFIAPGSSNQWCSITFGEKGSVTRGVSTSIKQNVNQPDAVMTITLFPEDPGYAVLRGVIQAMKAARGPLAATPFPGSAVNVTLGPSAETVAWADSHLLTEPDLNLSQEAAEVSATFALIDVVRK